MVNYAVDSEEDPDRDDIASTPRFTMEAAVART
jgi:hypothetical protein